MNPGVLIKHLRFEVCLKHHLRKHVKDVKGDFFFEKFGGNLSVKFRFINLSSQFFSW